MNNKLSFIILFILFSNFTLLFGQKQIWDIYTFDDQPYYNVVLDNLNSDTLSVKSMGNEYKILVKSVRIMKRKRKSRAGIGTFIGILAGALLMDVYATNNTKTQSGFPVDLSDFSVGFSTGLGAVGGAMIGYMVGAGLGTDEHYNLSKISLEKKRRFLKSLLDKNK